MKKVSEENLITESEEKLVKNVRINQRKRVKTLLLFLIVFNLFLLVSMTYFCFAFNNVIISIICLVIFCIIVWRSCMTFLKGKVDIQVKLYSDLLVINSYRGKTIVQLKDVYNVKIKKSLFQLIFKKPADALMLVVRNSNLKRVLISFISSDVQKLADKITIFSIRERARKNPEKEYN